MAKSLFSGIIFMVAFSLAGLSQNLPELDKSPMDAAYYRLERGAPPIAKVVYSRPLKNGRKVFGDLVPYDRIWRTGANEGTEITFYQDVIFGDEMVMKGTYTLFSKPGKSEWLVILNSELNQWGAYRRDASKDIFSTKGIPESVESEVEAFTITFDNQEDGSTHLVMAWDGTLVRVPVKKK